MQRNIDPVSRIIRFIFFDILLGGPLTGFSIPGGISILTGTAAVYLLFTVVTGYCPLVALYHSRISTLKK